MDNELTQIDNCTDKETKYKLTVAYMEKAGIAFKAAQKDHLNHQYRIMENESSIFVNVDYFKFNLCNSDKIKLDGKLGLIFEPLYKNKTQQIRDNVRPWTCNVVGAELLGKVINCLTGKILSAVGINVACLPKGYAENGHVICPNCDYVFIRADRCPECGQLIKYETHEEETLKDIDVPNLYMELCKCKTKKELVETWNKYGLSTPTKPIDNVTIDDRYVQFWDGSRIQISAASLKLLTSEAILNESYFDSVREKAIPAQDGNYRKCRLTMEKTIMNFEFILRYFVDHKYV